MIATTVAKKPRLAAPAWHARFVKMMPAIRKTAQIAFRKVRPELRHDLIEEVVANTLVAYARLVELGREDKAFASALARFAVAQVRGGRRVGSALRIRDVMSHYAQYQTGFHVERLDYFDNEEECWQQILVEDKRATPAEIAASRLDFAAWLRLLPSRRRKLALALAAGETTNAAATKFGVTPGRVSQIREWLRMNWLAFQGEAAPAKRPRLAAA